MVEKYKCLECDCKFTIDKFYNKKECPDHECKSKNIEKIQQ